jgi:hypothetical protein
MRGPLCYCPAEQSLWGGHYERLSSQIRYAASCESAYS